MTNHNTTLLNACLEPIYSLHPDPSLQLPEQQSLPPTASQMPVHVLLSAQTKI